MFKCPNCGGSMYYNIPSAKLKCRHCGSEIAPEDYGEKNDAEEQKDYEVTVYTCSNCGAELESPDDSIVSYCPYCGSEQVLEGRMGKALRPAEILPFTISKKKCQTKYEQALKGLSYLPKEFKSPEYLEQFRGIYIPYWKYDVEVRGGFPVEITESSTHGDYTDTYVYEGLFVPPDDPLQVNVDASGAFDDSIADKIAPFVETKTTDFRTGYLAGFYADRPNVDPHLYDETVMDKAFGALKEDISKAGVTKGGDDINIKEKTSISIRKCEEKLLPVWFLTWRKKNRVAYSIMNGTTGEMMADLPVDTRKYFISSLITAAVLFAVLAFLVSVTAPTALGFSVIMTLIVMLLFSSEMTQLRDRENHVYDPAYNGAEKIMMPAEKIEQIRSAASRSRARKKMSAKPFPGFMVSFGVYIVMMLVGSLVSVLTDFIPENTGSSTRYEGLLFVVFVSSVIAVVVLIRCIGKVRYIKEKGQGMVILLPFVSVWFALFVALSQTVKDYYFYAASIACLASTVVLSVALIHCYNILVTRPLPNFFNREGGKNDAED